MSISGVFKFFIRLLIAFLVVKLCLIFVGAGSPELLLGFSLGLVLLTYIFDFLDWFFEGALRKAFTPAEIGWRVARFLISMNVVGGPKEGIPGPEKKEGEKIDGRKPGAVV
jgi:hypothetical protein